MDQLVDRAALTSEEHELLRAAREVMAHAHVPYSRFQVGAALLTEQGRIVSGANVENIAYPLGSCAEQSAISVMIASGARRILKVAVIASGPLPVAPCGGCRQRLAEFAGPEVDVLMASRDGAVRRTTLGALLPGAFGADQMGL